MRPRSFTDEEAQGRVGSLGEIPRAERLSLSRPATADRPAAAVVAHRNAGTMVFRNTVSQRNVIMISSDGGDDKNDTIAAADARDDEKNAAAGAPSPAMRDASIAAGEDGTVVPARELYRAVCAEDWPSVVRWCESHPEAAGAADAPFLCRGERSSATLLHEACRRHPSLEAVDALVTAHPSSVLRGDDRGARLPVHVAVMYGASRSVAGYLLQCHPRCATEGDADGDAAAHYGAFYGADEILTLLLEADGGEGGGGWRVRNGRGKLPLHVLCSRCEASSAPRSYVQIETLRAVIAAYPEAVQTKDARGRLPLHEACNMYSPRLDVLDALLAAGPKTNDVRDSHGRTAFDLVVMTNPRMSVDANLTLSRLKNNSKTIIEKVAKMFAAKSKWIHRSEDETSSDRKSPPGVASASFRRHASPVTTKTRCYTLPY